MSGGGTGQGALYSPLPQTISDTDSSEEELISVVHHNDSRKFVVSGKETVDKRNGQKMGDYRPLDHDNEQDITINGFPSQQTTADNVPIIKTEGTLPRHSEPMSTMIKIFFVLSIVLCGLTIVVFLWVIPCDWATCPSAPLKTGTRSWEKTFKTIELKGTISVVPGVPGRSQNLLFLVRGDVTTQYLRQSQVHVEGAEALPPNGGGVLALIGSSGECAWLKKFRTLPHDIDCSLVDLNNDNINDCIVVGADNLLMAFDPVSSADLWLFHNPNNNHINATDIDFPLILPDLDEDNTNDLVSACRIITNDANSSTSSISDHNNLMLISGKKGIVIGQPFVIKNCTNISSLQIETENRYISFTCEQKVFGKVSSSARRQIQLQEVYAKSKNGKVPSFFNKMQSEYPPLKQHETPDSPDTVDGIWKRTYDVDRRILTITKQCTDHNCSIYAEVIVANHVVWNFTADNTDAMISVPLTLSNSSSSKKSYPSSASGFVLKFWQGNPEKRHISQDDPSTHSFFRNHLKGGKRSTNSWDSSMHNMTRRSVPVTKPGSNSNISIYHFHENIVIVIFSGTKSKTFNTSQNSIIQICLHGDPDNGRPSCQPNLGFQEQSMQIADLDLDGSQELISYLTTFTEDYDDDHSNNHWHLESKVRVIRLDTELVKLYESIDDH